MAIYSRGGNLKKVNNNGGLQQPQNQPNISSSPVRNVRFADEQGSGNGPNSLASTSSSSGPSSIGMPIFLVQNFTTRCWLLYRLLILYIFDPTGTPFKEYYQGKKPEVRGRL